MGEGEGGLGADFASVILAGWLASISIRPWRCPGPIATTAKSYCSTPLRDHTSAGRAVVPALRVEDLLKDIDNVQYVRRGGYPFHSSRTPLALHHPPIEFEATIPFGNHGSLPLVFGTFFPESSRCK
jgi:hypothetical protein